MKQLNTFSPQIHLHFFFLNENKKKWSNTREWLVTRLMDFGRRFIFFDYVVQMKITDYRGAVTSGQITVIFI